MVCRIKKSAEEQFKAERRRFLARQKGKPVLAEQIKSREEREFIKHQREQEKGQEKIFLGDIQ
jgi:hypothetical protein